MAISRRQYLQASGALATGFFGLHNFLVTPALADDNDAGFGPLVPDPDGVLDLPEGFRYQVFSRTGDEMQDGWRVPGMHDGMAAFAGPRGTTLLVRNHELETKHADMSAFGDKNQLLPDRSRGALYDHGRGVQPALGGTTTLVYDTKQRKLLSHFMSLAGTSRNCAGGPTSWGSWLTCEETVDRARGNGERDHGYAFEVPATARPKLAKPVPLTEMGRFRREAVAEDSWSGIIYQTEDRDDSLIYRFLPNQKKKLAKGGRLQALKIKEQRGVDTRNWGGEPTIAEGQSLAVEWVDMTDVQSPHDDLRRQGHEKGAARFARGEGMWYDRKIVYWACTNGGRKKLGQIWRYHPSLHEGQRGEDRAPGRLELLAEPNDSELLKNADNLTVAPWGDVIVCEDSDQRDFVVGITPRGEYYKLARNAMGNSEFAGSVFSPDGSTLFVNIQSPGRTLAITGPWPKMAARPL